MVDITIYTAELCGYCYRAKALLDEKGVAFNEIDVSYDPAERARMIQRAGGKRTVPQIFIGQTYVGGCDELYALNANGGLDPLLRTI